ncbi:MAG TPA: signal peptidase II [Jatrophihabitans sp.]|uniref:signal peptidase II n=1 Tax=Jatrophihabitans sp. TaxID=1932789 RepID=UPI002E006354|nr:signal peptidase II [Jatrophihabitans sp.]
MTRQDDARPDPVGATPDDQPAAPAEPRRVAFFVVVAVAVFGLDLLSKVLVAANLPLGHDPVRLLGGALYLNQMRNSGAAFSLGTGFTVILTVVALAVVVVIVRTAARMHSTRWAIALGLILGGALGNLVDRIFRSPGFLRGHVVDWISVFGKYDDKWPIFNIADSGIVCGAILAGLLAVIGVEIDGRRASAKHTRHE